MRFGTPPDRTSRLPRSPFTPDDDVDGLIDEVRIYDVALTAGEIATLHSSVAVFKELVSATENSPSNSDGDLQTNEDWEFVMRVTVANNTSDDVTNATVRDPLPGDLELGDLTSGTVAACEENDTTTGAGDDFDGITVSPSIGTVTILERGKTDKCIIDWSIPDGELDAGEFVTLTITASTDVNPRGIRTGDPEEFQEYTTAATNCINQGAKLTGTLDSTPVIIQSNGLEVTDGDELPDDVAFVKHDDCG